MSRTDAEIVQPAFAAFNARDVSTLEMLFTAPGRRSAADDRHLKTSSASSGAAATVPIRQVYACRGARISALDSYYTADEALKAVGLEE